MGFGQRSSSDDLDDLRWHWGGAYVISNPSPGTWLAQRRDDRTTVRADNPVQLRFKITADYAARPVPRGVYLEEDP